MSKESLMKLMEEKNFCIDEIYNIEENNSDDCCLCANEGVYTKAEHLSLNGGKSQPSSQLININYYYYLYGYCNKHWKMLLERHVTSEIIEINFEDRNYLIEMWVADILEKTIKKTMKALMPLDENSLINRIKKIYNEIIIEEIIK